MEGLEASKRIGVVDLGHDSNVYLLYPQAAHRLLNVPLGIGACLHALLVIRLGPGGLASLRQPARLQPPQTCADSNQPTSPSSTRGIQSDPSTRSKSGHTAPHCKLPDAVPSNAASLHSGGVFSPGSVEQGPGRYLTATLEHGGIGGHPVQTSISAALSIPEPNLAG